MAVLAFLLILGVVAAVMLIAGFGIALFSWVGGYDRDPYEEELRQLDRDDRFVAALENTAPGLVDNSVVIDNRKQQVVFIGEQPWVLNANGRYEPA